MSRPRTFDLDEATDRALKVFWAHGYEGTTLTDLTDAMGINRPSLYAAFGSKEGLFMRAVDRYVTVYGREASAALSATTARDTAERLLRFYAEAAAAAGRVPGCILVQGALVCGEESRTVKTALAEKRHALEHALAARFVEGKKAGELPEGSRPADLARWIMTVCQGLAVQAAGGATREQLRKVVQLTLSGWPGGD